MTNDANAEAVLPQREDWHGNVRPASMMEVSRAEGTAIRIRGEVAEIRAAAERLAGGTPFEVAVAQFLTVQAEQLERNGATPLRADSLRDLEDTREHADFFETAARSALLIARAHNELREKTS